MGTGIQPRTILCAGTRHLRMQKRSYWCIFSPREGKDLFSRLESTPAFAVVLYSVQCLATQYTPMEQQSKELASSPVCCTECFSLVTHGAITTGFLNGSILYGLSFFQEPARSVVHLFVHSSELHCVPNIGLGAGHKGKGSIN